LGNRLQGNQCGRAWFSSSRGIGQRCQRRRGDMLVRPGAIGEVVRLAPSLSWFAPRGKEEDTAPHASMTA